MNYTSEQMLALGRNGHHSGVRDDAPASTKAPGAAVPLILESAVAMATAQPVTVGVPWPRGLLTCDRVLSLCDQSGHAVVPLQTKPMAMWPDGSVKWLLVDFIVGPLQEGMAAWSLQLNDGEPPVGVRPNPGFRVEENDHEILVETGRATFTLDRNILAPVVQIEIDGSPILDPTRSQTVLIDARGRRRRPRIRRHEIETSGPVRATVRFEGDFDGFWRHRLRFCARISFFADMSLIRVELTIHNPRRAYHRNGLWDLGDPGSVCFRDLSLCIGLGGRGCGGIHWTEDVDGFWRTTDSKTFEVYQESSGGENWQSRNHVNRFGTVPNQFCGYRVCLDNRTSFGLRASPVVCVEDSAGCVTAGIPEFWQQFPKAINADCRVLNLRLFPGQFGDLFELQGGEQKTHTMWLHFGRHYRSQIDSLKWVHQPAHVHCTPGWCTGTAVFPQIHPASASDKDRFESYVSAVIDGPNSFFARREIIDEYGWRNYGEVYADHEALFYDGKSPVISHYNNQYDIICGSLIQYMRTGTKSWFDLAECLARHVSDIDIYHTNEDKAAYNGGLFWHTDHYRDASTSTHRAYSRANCGPLKSSYGGGPCNEHNYTTGLLYFYYMTGNPLARDAVLSLADWVVGMDDGGRNILGLIDDGPTGYCSSTVQGDYHGPGRGSGNSINALLDGWLVTGSRGYLDKADDLIRRAVHPAMNIAALDLLNTELRWSYTVFLSVLVRYVELKAEAGEVDKMYAYARATLLSFASWMMENEVPYFDRPEELEFPTETWAAQEFRKANVLRFAAQHADAPFRRRLIDRAGELAERAWSDLARFESRHVARAVALLLVEGTRDSYWRDQPVDSIPAPLERV